MGAQLQKDISLLDEQRAEAVDTRNKEKHKMKKQLKNPRLPKLPLDKPVMLLLNFMQKQVKQLLSFSYLVQQWDLLNGML